MACHSSRSWTDCVTALRSRLDRVIAFRQISVTALLYLDNSRKIHLQGIRARRPKDAKRRAPQRAGAGGREESAHAHMGERGRESLLALLFICFFLPPRACPMQIGLGHANWAWPGALFYLKSSLLGPSLVLFSQAFPFLVF